MIWVLVLMIMTSDGRVVFYDQGSFQSEARCIEVGVAMVDELKSGTLGTPYQFDCIKYKL